MDAKLPWYQRLGVWLHLLYCVWCRRYAAQIQFLRAAAHQLPSGLDALPSHRLSSEATDQIRRRLQEALRKTSPPPP